MQLYVVANTSKHMTDIVTAPGPSTYARVAVLAGSNVHAIAWGTGDTVQLEDKTSVSMVASGAGTRYVGVVHGFTPVAEERFTVAAIVVAGFACIAIPSHTAKDWPVGCRVYCVPGTQTLTDSKAANNVLVGYVVPGPPRIPIVDHDHLDIVVARGI
jgi:predicted RecA/RadA family phage recombinase